MCLASYVHPSTLRLSLGVLFIDEAYDLGKGIYGEEAMTTLLRLLTEPAYANDKTIVIVAGYRKEMAARVSVRPTLLSAPCVPCCSA